MIVFLKACLWKQEKRKASVFFKHVVFFMFLMHNFGKMFQAGAQSYILWNWSIFLVFSLEYKKVKRRKLLTWNALRKYAAAADFATALKAKKENWFVDVIATQSL